MILTIRDDPEKWYTSYVNSLLWLYRTWWFKPFTWVLPMGWKLHVRAPQLSLHVHECMHACLYNTSA